MSELRIDLVARACALPRIAGWKGTPIKVVSLVTRGVFGFLGLALLGCTSADNEMAGGNIQAINHTLKGINWVSVNGYRADGGGGRSCCLVLPVKWRPGLKADIEWEADPDPFAYSKWPPLGTDGYRAAQTKHKANYQRYGTTVDIPEWSGSESCDFKIHFLACNQIKVTTSCWAPSAPDYPIKDPMGMKEPAVCPS